MSAKRDAMLDEARARLTRGDHAGGERSLKKLLRSRPADAEGLYLLGALQLQEGKAAEAARLMRRALDCGKPPDPAVLENLGTAYLVGGDPAAAERELRRAIAAGGTRSLLRMRLGMALAGLERLEEAEALLRTAQQQDPQDADIGINLGNVLASRGFPDAALEQYSKVLDATPGHAQALYNIGTLHRAAGRDEEAITAYLQALAIAPDHIEALINLGTLRERQGDDAEAERLYRKVLALNPDHAIAYSNLSSALRAQGRIDEAEQCCRRALEIRPDFADAMVNLAGLHGERGQLDAARRGYYRAWQMAPADTELRVWCGTLGLSLGEFAESWPHYQARASRPHVLRVVGALDEQLPDDINGATILLVGEQGIGDELFFLRYAGLLKVRKAKLFCVGDHKIRALLDRTVLFDALYAHGETLPQRDLTFAVGDLPQILGCATPADAAMMAPLRLLPLPARIESMRGYLEQVGPPPYLALTWRAGTPMAEQRNWRIKVLSKEVPLDVLAAAVQGFRGSILSLQRNPDAGETEHFAALLGAPVHDASALNAELEDMLALLGLLDEYVGVSNANMHLLAGLGGRARVLVPNPAEWRWMASGRVSPWFPRFTVYRQAGDRTWDQAKAQLRADLFPAPGVVTDGAP